MPETGDSLGGRYRLEGRIAAGGMGEVWQAVDTVLDRPVAVKVLLAGSAAEPTFRRRFAHEARVMAALRHPGVAAVYDYGTTPDGAYLVMARIDGQSLDRRLAERGPLSPAETMVLVAQAARALHVAHRAGIVHRDVTPGNLIIEPDGTVVLVDFGVARSSSSEILTGAHNIIGTASYMAPEQVSKQTIGPAADLYALGAVAFHCLAGHPPFTGVDAVAIALRHVTDKPPPLPPGVPAPVRALVERAMAKDPAARHPSAAALAAAATTAGGEDPTLLAPAATTAGGEDATRLAAAPGPLPHGEPLVYSAAGTYPHPTAEPITVPVARPTLIPAPGHAAPPVSSRAGLPHSVWAPVLTAVAALLIGSGMTLAVADPHGWFRAPPVQVSPSPQSPPGPATSPAPSPNPPRSTAAPRKNPPRTSLRTSRRTPSPSISISASADSPSSESPDGPSPSPPTGPSDPAEEGASAPAALGRIKLRGVAYEFRPPAEVNSTMNRLFRADQPNGAGFALALESSIDGVAARG